jgi:hypothetical protein
VNVVYFIQPDEQALAGSYVIFENFYVDDEQKESKETKITVSDTIKVNYQIPAQLQLNKPTLSTLTINNFGTEIVTSLKICLSSPDNVVSFSESCKSWTNLPSGYNDKFTVYINGLIPGTYQNQIKATIDYTTFTGLAVSKTYYQPSLQISATKTEKPSLSYTVTKTNESIIFSIKNDGDGIAYDCLVKLASPANCFINSSDIANYTKVSILINPPAENTYLIRCSDLILPNDKSVTTINFNPSQINPPCSVSGSIFYKDGLGDSHETKISKFNLIETVTTLPIKDFKDRKTNNLYILIIAIVTIAVILVVFKVPKVRNFLSQKLSKITQRLSKLLKKKSNGEQKNKE